MTDKTAKPAPAEPTLEQSPFKEIWKQIWPEGNGWPRPIYRMELV
jgi:hypothetical protein